MNSKIKILTFILVTFCLQLKSQNQSNIQDLIDIAPNNSTVNIPFGHYTSNRAITIKNRNSLLIVFAPGSEIFCSNMDAEVVIIGGSQNIKIINGLFKHLKVQDLCSGAVFYIYSSVNIFLENCDINGCGIHGVSAFDSKNLIVKDCFIHENRYSAYSFNRYCSGIKLISNKLENNQKFPSWEMDYLGSIDIQEGVLVKTNSSSSTNNTITNPRSNSLPSTNQPINSKGNVLNDIGDFGISTFEVVKEGWKIMNSDPQETTNKLINDGSYQDNLEKKYDNFSKSVDKIDRKIQTVTKATVKTIKK